MYFSKSPGGYSTFIFIFVGVYIYIIGLFVLWEISRHTVILLCLGVFFLYGYCFFGYI